MQIILHFDNYSLLVQNLLRSVAKPAGGTTDPKIIVIIIIIIIIIIMMMMILIIIDTFLVRI